MGLGMRMGDLGDPPVSAIFSGVRQRRSVESKSLVIPCTVRFDGSLDQISACRNDIDIKIRGPRDMNPEPEGVQYVCLRTGNPALDERQLQGSRNYK